MRDDMLVDESGRAVSFVLVLHYADETDHGVQY